MQLFILFLSLGVLFINNAVAEDAYGIDDWNATEIKRFFETNYVSIPENFTDALLDLGIDTGIKGLSLSDEQLESLGISKDLHEKYHAATKNKLEAVQHNPVDIFEWRVLNRHLCDYWIIPLVLCPHFGLIWLRFYGSSVGIHRLTSVITEMAFPEFWLTWLITPSYPLFKISLMMSSNGTFIDNVLQWVLFASMLDELSTFVKIMEIPEHSLWKYLAELWEIVYSKIIISSFYFISSSFSYYVVYWFIPRFISDFFFLLGVYVFIPLGILRRLKYSISKILKGSYVLTGDRKKLLMKFNMIIMLTAIVIVLVSLISFWV